MAELTPDQKKTIRAKVDEYLPEFLAQIERPEQNRHYALTYAIQLLAKQLGNTTPPDGTNVEDTHVVNSFVEYLDACTKPETPKSERQRLKDQMMKRYGKGK